MPAQLSVAPRASGQVQTPLSVLYAVLSMEPGGLERLVLDLVRKSLERGHRASIVCVSERGKLAAEAERLGVDVFCLHKESGRCPGTVDKAERLLRDLQPDIIHTHQTGALWYLGQAAQRVRGIAVLHTEHSDHVAHAKSWKQKLKTRLLWRRTAKWAGQFCCVSEDIALSVRRWGTVPARDVDVVLNGIDTELYRRQSGRTETRQQLNIPADAKVIGTVGRLVEVKRQDQLIRAFSELVRRFQTQPSFSPSGLRLLIVGDGSERQALERLAVELGIAEWVVFAGYQARPERFYQAMDVFALSSRHEGLPLALLEAWAASVPVVVPAVGGLAKVVSDGQTGLLFSRGDETALALKLEQLLKDEAYSGRLAAAGAELVERQYSVDRMVDEYELRYRRLIAAA